MDGEKTYRTSNKCWVVFAACCLVDMIGFTVPTTCFSVFLTPMKEALGLTMFQVQLYNTAMMICTIVSTMFGDKFMKMGAGKLTAVMSAAVMVGYLLMAFVPSIASITLAGCLAGIAYPLLSIYTMPVIVGNWFATRQGTWISLVLACSGLGGLIISPLATSLIASFGWQHAMALVSLLMLVPLACGVFVIRTSPLEQGILPHGATSDELEGARGQGDGSAEPPELAGATLGDALRTPAFYLVAIAMFGIGITSAYAGNMNPIIQAAGYSAATAAAGLSAMSLGNLVCKPILGIMRDALGAVPSGAIGYGCMILGFVLIFASTALGSPAFVIVAAFITGLGGGAGLIMPSLYVKDAFGSKDFDRVYSIQMGVRSVGSAVAAPIASLVYDLAGGYNPAIALWTLASAAIIVTGWAGVKLGRAGWESTR